MKTRSLLLFLLTVVALVLAGGQGPNAQPPVSGAIFTTDSICNRPNVNIYDAKEDVYLNGGPQHPGAAGLPDGYYYVKVTEPDGTLLGTSIGTANQTPVHVANGEFDQCYELYSILIKSSDQSPGFDDTLNPGGEYKVWVSSELSFNNNSTKTDNFKVRPGNEPTLGKLTVDKCYDADLNGECDDSNPPLCGWSVIIQQPDGFQLPALTPVTLDQLDYGTYSVSEVLPPNWVPTGPVTKEATIAQDAPEKKIEFTNVCLGSGGGLTLGFWSNKNGQNLITVDDFAFLKGLNLVNANGGAFDPVSTPASLASDKTAFRTWLLGGSATNMAYMLSVQLAAMELNVRHGFLTSSFIYAPGTNSASPAGFATVADIMAEANAELGLHSNTLSDSPYRSYQEALKNALDNANNNKNFVQAQPCGFSCR